MVNFQQYDNDNPEIWVQFVKFAKEAKAKGFKKYSAYGIFEQIRWHTQTHGNDGFKVNNNYRPDYARKMESQFPEFEHFFEKRVLKSARIKK